jgi:hypothetical protein
MFLHGKASPCEKGEAVMKDCLTAPAMAPMKRFRKNFAMMILGRHIKYRSRLTKRLQRKIFDYPTIDTAIFPGNNPAHAMASIYDIISNPVHPTVSFPVSYR